MEMKHLRGAFTQEIEKLAEYDKTIFTLATDSRGSVTLADFAKHLPEQFVECGIAEQDAVGIAAGLANAGLRPFVCGPACFFSMRSAEQVKVDVAYSHTNVKIIGVSGGVSYGALGSTHHSTQDIALMRAIPGIEVYIPSDAVQMTALTDYLASNVPGVASLVNQSQASLDYTVTNGVFHSDNIFIEGDVFSIKATGSYDIPADKLDFTVRLQLLKNDSILGKLVAEP